MRLDLGLSLTSLPVLSSKGAGGPFRSKAQAILAAISAGGYPADATGDDLPVVTQGATYGQSTLNLTAYFGNSDADKQPSVQWDDARLSPLGDALVLHPNQKPYFKTNNDNGSGLVGKGVGVGYRFLLNGDAIEVGTFSNSVRLKVNGKWTAAAKSTQPAYLKWTFPSKKVRTIEVYIEGVTTGINIRSADTISVAPLDQLTSLKGMFIGDSYAESLYDISKNSSLYPTSGWPNRMREALGMTNMVPLGVGGQGAVKTAGSATFLSRGQAGDFARFPDRDLIIVYNSVNDGSSTVATVKANWKATLEVLKPAQPNAIIWGFSGFKTTGYNVDAAHNAAFIEAFNEAKDPARMACWDGDNQIITLGGGGNEATYIGDGTHFNDLGAAYAPTVLIPQLATFLQTL